MTDRLRPVRRRLSPREYAPCQATRVLHDGDGYRVLLVPTPKGIVIVSNHWYSRSLDQTRFYAWDQLRNMDHAYFGGDTVKFLRKISGGPDGRGHQAPPPDPEFEKAYPALWEYLTVTQWAKDQPRKTSTITFFVDDGAWKASLNDRDQGYNLYGTGATWEECLNTLEELLAAPGGTPWRKSREWSPPAAADVPRSGPKKRSR